MWQLVCTLTKDAAPQVAASTDRERLIAHTEDKFIVKNGDLLFAWSASLGAYIWRGQEAWLNQHIFRVDHTKMIDRLFLYYTPKYTTVM